MQDEFIIKQDAKSTLQKLFYCLNWIPHNTTSFFKLSYLVITFCKVLFTACEVLKTKFFSVFVHVHISSLHYYNITLLPAEIRLMQCLN